LNAETEQDNCLSTSGTNNALRFQGYVKLLSFRKLNSISWNTILYQKRNEKWIEQRVGASVASPRLEDAGTLLPGMIMLRGSRARTGPVSIPSPELRS
jgi:hypothetical protein